MSWVHLMDITVFWRSERAKVLRKPLKSLCNNYTFLQIWRLVVGPVYKAQKSLRFLVSACVASDPRVGIFNFVIYLFAIKRCPIAAKIAGLIEFLSYCVLNDFVLHRGMNVFPICEASLLATILCIWEILSPCIHVSRISLLAKKNYKIKLMTRNRRICLALETSVHVQNK